MRFSPESKQDPRRSVLVLEKGVKCGNEADREGPFSAPGLQGSGDGRPTQVHGTPKPSLRVDRSCAALFSNEPDFFARRGRDGGCNCTFTPERAQTPVVRPAERLYRKSCGAVCLEQTLRSPVLRAGIPATSGDPFAAIKKTSSKRCR